MLHNENLLWTYLLEHERGETAIKSRGENKKNGEW